MSSLFTDGDRNPKFYFSRSAPYRIYFPPALREYYDKGKETKDDKFGDKLFMLEEEEELILSDEIKGTGKTATMKNVCIKANMYPLVEIKGSNLTPTESDQSAEILPLQKFAYTLSELEWNLVKECGFEREENGEVRYILFVDEANQISNNSGFFQPNQLRFLKDCMEGIDKKEVNLFIENNPDAQTETEDDETDEDGNPTGNKVKLDIEIGEFLEFFWAVKKRNIMSYDGSFESIKKETIERVLDTRLRGTAAGFLIGDKADKESAEREKLLMQNQQYKDAKHELDTQINNNNQTQNQINDIVGKINGVIPKKPHETDEYLNTQLAILTSNLRNGESRLDKLRSELDKLRKSLGGNSNLMSLLGLDKLSFTDKVMIVAAIVLLVWLLKG
ncbi:5801_t:CDS:2 [Ambispora gerdemannii]|uniref:5801_t:CDS:1 n=1 Tax=Ambispora gerdemannii TaxID=144530 RepID=A0A9N9CNQ4_9GLOM|nr:5801_t:CDS:2 [Ambispora gerdemannii]